MSLKVLKDLTDLGTIYTRQAHQRGLYCSITHIRQRFAHTLPNIVIKIVELNGVGRGLKKRSVIKMDTLM